MQTYTRRIIRGKYQRRMPVMHFTLSMVFCRAHPTIFTCSCSHCIRYCTWHCTWVSISGLCPSTMATLKCRQYLSLLSMAQHTIPTITCTIHTTTVSTSLCGIASVALSATQALLRGVDRWTKSWNWNQSSRRKKRVSGCRLNVIFLKWLYFSFGFISWLIWCSCWLIVVVICDPVKSRMSCATEESCKVFYKVQLYQYISLNSWWWVLQVCIMPVTRGSEQVDDPLSVGKRSASQWQKVFKHAIKVKSFCLTQSLLRNEVAFYWSQTQ